MPLVKFLLYTIFIFKLKNANPIKKSKIAIENT